MIKKNIELNDSRVRALNDDVLTCHSEVPDHSLDLIISNPPYIISSELNALQPEVRFEPQMALDGGSDGLFFYNAIIRDWSRKHEFAAFHSPICLERDRGVCRRPHERIAFAIKNGAPISIDIRTFC